MCCGILFDKRASPAAIECTIPALDTLELDQFVPWDIEHLQSIHAGKVTRPLERDVQAETAFLIIQRLIGKPYIRLSSLGVSQLPQCLLRVQATRV